MEIARNAVLPNCIYGFMVDARTRRTRAQGWPAQSLRVGTAGWGIPRDQAARLVGAGSHLARYATVMNCAEINSTFYRAHRASTYERWAAATPAAFQFSVKVPRAITHHDRLQASREQMQRFLEEVSPLGDKLGPLLFQLPPKRSFVEREARAFLTSFRELAPSAQAVIEPRHAGWFTEEAAMLLREFQMTPVRADPPPVQGLADEDGESPLAYYRLHGVPRVYYSSYSAEYLDRLAGTLGSGLRRGTVWCIFDNTAAGAAIGNALTLMDRMADATPSP